MEIWGDVFTPHVCSNWKKRLFALLPSDKHKSWKDKRVGDRQGIKASTASYVAPCQRSRCWSAGGALGSVTQNNHGAGSLPSNVLTAQREKGYCLSVMALCLPENDNTRPELVPWAVNRKEADETTPATQLRQRACTFTGRRTRRRRWWKWLRPNVLLGAAAATLWVWCSELNQHLSPLLSIFPLCILIWKALIVCIFIRQLRRRTQKHFFF